VSCLLLVVAALLDLQGCEPETHLQRPALDPAAMAWAQKSCVVSVAVSRPPVRLVFQLQSMAELSPLYEFCQGTVRVLRPERCFWDPHFVGSEDLLVLSSRPDGSSARTVTVVPSEGPERVVYSGRKVSAFGSPAAPLMVLWPDLPDTEQRLGLLDLRTGRDPRWFGLPDRIDCLEWSYAGNLFVVVPDAEARHHSVLRLGLDRFDASEVWATDGDSSPLIMRFSRGRPDWLLVQWSTAQQLKGSAHGESLGVLDTTTGKVKVCATGRINGPCAGSSPQGDLVAFVRSTDTPSAESKGKPFEDTPTGPKPTALCLVSLSDGSERVLARGTDQMALAFLSDSEIAYLTQDNARASLRVVRTDGSGDHEVWSLAKPKETPPGVTYDR
jgi:hypothetical protein